MQNGFMESFIGKLRDECLNENVFTSLVDARRIIEAWRMDYNEVRPHSSLGYLTPEGFAAACSEQASPSTPQPAVVLARVKAKPSVAAKSGQP